MVQISTVNFLGIIASSNINNTPTIIKTIAVMKAIVVKITILIPEENIKKYNNLININMKMKKKIEKLVMIFKISDQVEILK